MTRVIFPEVAGRSAADVLAQFEEARQQRTVEELAEAGVYLPTPDEIAAATARIPAGWSDDECFKR